MKRLRLLRGVMVNGAGHAENAVVDVSDADARLLLGGDAVRGLGPDAVLLEDLGVDQPPPPSVPIEVLHAVMADGKTLLPGRHLVSQAAAKALINSPRVRFPNAEEPPATAPAREKAKR